MGVEQFWAFGGRERGSDKKFVVCLGWGGKRDRVTLEPLIKKYVNRGSIINTDCWSDYNGLAGYVDGNGRSLNYTHHMVNHSRRFVNPNDPNQHTQTIERLWGDLKEHVKKGVTSQQN